MSQEFMDPEILADFFAEAKEHLETIEPNLLQLEQTPENLGLLNEIFRPMHSLKGASGFLGLNAINRLAHKAENILDELRQGSMSVTSEIMDLILSATDALRTMVDNLEASGTEGDVQIEPLVERIEALLSGGSCAAPGAPPEQPAGAAAPAQETVAVDQSSPAQDPAASPVADDAPATVPVDESAGKDRFSFETDPDFDATPYELTTVGEGHLSDFLEEAADIIASLNNSLLALEAQPDNADELVNDTFRYFHNLKGNSGIIGFRELNGLTHEAETLLNKVRKGDLELTRPLIDLLLAVVDMIEELVSKVEAGTGMVVPVDCSGLVRVLAQATEEGVVPDMGRAPAEQPVETAMQSANEPANEQAAAQPEAEPAAQAPAAAVPQGIDPEDLAIFDTTVHQQMDNLEQSLDELRRDAGQKRFIDGLYRSLVTLQNSSGYMGLSECATYAERTAGLVDQARKGDMDFSLMLDILDQEIAILRDMLFKVLDAMSSGESAAPAPAPAAVPPAASAPAPKAAPAPAPKPASAAKAAPAPAPKPAPAPAAARPAPAPKAAPAAPVAARPEPEAPSAKAQPSAGPSAKPKVSSTIRVDHQKLDHLMNLIGELIINRNRYTLLARALEEGQQEVHAVAQQLTETTYAMARISDDLQDTIMNVRMVPVQTVFSRFPRLVRDLSRKSGKQIELITEGEETELDKSVVEEIGDPLVHLVRNAVDHGLEPEEERVADGKSPVGHVWLRAYHKGNSVAIEVEDDGRGIDPEKMRATAVKKGIMTADEAKNLDDREALELIFHPGFSSAEKVTDISGRGVGMDVVKNNIKSLKGSVHTKSEVGKGTKLTLSLPLTLAIIDALIIEVAGDTFAIPLDAVSETTKIHADKLSDVNQRKAITLRGEVLGIIELAELLDLPTNEEAREILPVVIVHDNDRRVGLVVDRLLERQEIVIKPLGQYLSEFKLDGISGATIMGDGSVVLILDPHEIYSLATNYTKPASRSLERPGRQQAKALREA
jgi:two-component system chemotaxis sensor kinase CheA